jgi:hypothetical protein
LVPIIEKIIELAIFMKKTRKNYLGFRMGEEIWRIGREFEGISVEVEEAMARSGRFWSRREHPFWRNFELKKRFWRDLEDFVNIFVGIFLT